MQTDSGMIALFIVGGAFLLFALIIALMYNSLVRLRNLIRESWSDVDTELKRRHDLIPNLVSAVRGYMKYESSVLERITQLRSMAQTSKPGEELAKMENEITGGLRQIFAVVEKYPELKSSTQVADLQRELVRTEDRIQAARRFFNGNVRDYNIKVESVPTNIIAGVFGFQKAEFFEIDQISDRELPSASLS